MPAIDLTGQRFGRLLVIARASNLDKRATWVCLCDCGNKARVIGKLLRREETRSCGCLRSELVTGRTHGRCYTPEHGIWNTMIQRCRNPRTKTYVYYGGRGITVCERWLKFENFWDDMGPRPSSKHSIERKDNDKGYEPGNCAWATRLEQAKNRRSNRNNTSGVNGVGPRANGKWYARITVNSKMVHIGYFDDIETAAAARRDAEVKYWGKVYG